MAASEVLPEVSDSLMDLRKASILDAGDAESVLAVEAVPAVDVLDVVESVSESESSLALGLCERMSLIMLCAVLLSPELNAD